MDPVLYIFMRTDMDSLNPGKAMAQAAHAQALFTATILIGCDFEADILSPIAALYNQWQGDYGFGTTIILDAGDLDHMIYVANLVSQHESVMTGIVTAPTYPLQDGDAMHYFPVSTCAFVFLDKAEGIGGLVNLELHP